METPREEERAGASIGSADEGRASGRNGDCRGWRLELNEPGVAHALGYKTGKWLSFAGDGYSPNASTPFAIQAPRGSLRLGDDGSPDESPRLRVVYRFVAVVLLDGATPVVRPSQIPRLLSGPFSNFFYNCLLIFTPLLHSKEVLERSTDG
ncbi:hypothetical protein BHE74_00028901 [Ensete ventricosum]|nr:hypothetical protein GW17_00017150 [Ensete ventricosum]RWW63903.1 hypothetical protein BHE74_00028901 [Ensete ventricosum]